MLLWCISGLSTGLSLAKMAEVGQKLRNGAYRLSALKTGQTRPVGPGGGSVRSTSSQSPVRERSVTGRREDEPASERRARGRKPNKLWTVRKIKSQPQTEHLLSAPSCLETRFVGFCGGGESLRAHAAAPYLQSAGLFQEKLRSTRRTLWTAQSDALRPPQHPRALCTVVFILAPERPASGLRRPRPGALKGPEAARSYSWWSEEAPAPSRSKTAYYDTLNVSPTATQAQIKTAYYKQSFIHHPDKNPDDKKASERFSAVSEAYAVLGNISLRKKYDRGILSQSDIQGAGRSSSKRDWRRSGGSSQQQQQQQQRARHFTRPGGKPIYDFDAFYQAHYGEQLQREKAARARKQQMEMQNKKQQVGLQQDTMEGMMLMVLAMGGLICLTLLK